MRSVGGYTADPDDYSPDDRSPAQQVGDVRKWDHPCDDCIGGGHRSCTSLHVGIPCSCAMEGHPR